MIISFFIYTFDYLDVCAILQVDKLRIEREERARAGAPTPPMPIAPPEPVDTRHVLQPVERGENPDSPDNQLEKETDEGGSEDGKKGGEKSGDGDDKDSSEKKKMDPQQVKLKTLNREY